jgi:uncharacterized surface protein with fasciclin (FAS1) repeats
LNVLNEALNLKGLSGALAATGQQLTLFAPTDLAFQNFAFEAGCTGCGDNAVLLDFLSKFDLNRILLYHVVAGKTAMSDFSHGAAYETVLSQQDWALYNNSVQMS